MRDLCVTDRFYSLQHNFQRKCHIPKQWIVTVTRGLLLCLSPVSGMSSYRRMKYLSVGVLLKVFVDDANHWGNHSSDTKGQKCPYQEWLCSATRGHLLTSSANQLWRCIAQTIPSAWPWGVLRSEKRDSDRSECQGKVTLRRVIECQDSFKISSTKYKPWNIIWMCSFKIFLVLSFCG